MATVQAAAVYARISSDTEGSALGVSRQVEDCRRLAASLGWTVAEIYADNDLSAYSGKRRPRYQDMLMDLREGRRDAVLCYHVDRLTRRPIELEEFVGVLDAARVRHVRFVAGGEMNLGTGDGLLVGRIMAAVAANESASKSRRVKRKLDEVAAEGRPHGGAHRPFGYDDDKITVRPAEAAVIRTLVARYIAGESLRSLCIWLQEEGIRTVAGGMWRSSTVRYLISAGRIAGLRDHRGDVVGPAVWQPIITSQERDRVLARMVEQGTSGRRTPRNYLLSGMLRCGKCGNTLFSSRRVNTRRYVCLSGPDHGGCGRLTVVAEPLEYLVTSAVLYRLDTPQMADALAGRSESDADAAALGQQLAADRDQLAELAQLYGRREITAPEWLTARRSIEQRMQDAQARLGRLTRTSALHGLTSGGQLREQWATLNLTRQAAIVRALLDHGVIGPGSPAARSLDPERVQLLWRM